MDFYNEVNRFFLILCLYERGINGWYNIKLIGVVKYF